MKVVIVAQAWGKTEAQFLHPLVGPTGRELTLGLGIADLAPYLRLSCRSCKKKTFFIDNRCEHCRESIWPTGFDLLDHWKLLRDEHQIAVTNVFNDYPPNDDLGIYFGTENQTPMPAWKASKNYKGTHLKLEFYHHVERLYKEIETLKPNLLILLGNAACWATLGQTKISELRGSIAWSTKLNVKCLPTYHPSAILHEPRLRATWLADLKKAAREINSPNIYRPERWLTIPSPNQDGINEIAQWFKQPALRYSNDIETLRGQISIVGFGRSSDEALVIPFRDAHIDKQGRIIDIGKIANDIGFSNGGINFWPTDELEIQAWKLVQQGLESPVPKTFQNGVFDMGHYLRMGLQTKNARHDLMLWHHSLYPELPKSLGYMGSIYCNEVSWKQMRHSDGLKRDE